MLPLILIFGLDPQGFPFRLPIVLASTKPLPGKIDSIDPLGSGPLGESDGVSDETWQGRLLDFDPLAISVDLGWPAPSDDLRDVVASAACLLDDRTTEGGLGDSLGVVVLEAGDVDSDRAVIGYVSHYAAEVTTVVTVATLPCTSVAVAVTV